MLVTLQWRTPHCQDLNAYMNTTFARLLGAALIVLGLTPCGCTRSRFPSEPRRPLTAQDKKALSAWIQQKKQRLAQTDWTAQGKIALVYQSYPKKGFHANFFWCQEKDHYRVRLYSPFTTWSISLEKRGDQAFLTLANGQRLTAHSPELLMEKALGIPLPISHLSDWLWGLPVSPLPPTPKDPCVTELCPNLDRVLDLDREGRILQMQEQGFILSPKNYHSLQGMAYPTKISLKRENLEIKLSITTLQLEKRPLPLTSDQAVSDNGL